MKKPPHDNSPKMIAGVSVSGEDRTRSRFSRVADAVVVGLAVTTFVGVFGLLWRLAFTEKLEQQQRGIAELNQRVSDLTSRLDTIETRVQVTTVVPRDPRTKRPTDGLLSVINMDTVRSLDNVRVPTRFHVEWGRGPVSKVLQVYQHGDPTPLVNTRIKNGQLITLPPALRGQVELKTWWDNGTREREEGVWVFIEDGM